MWWSTPIVPALYEADAGGSQVGALPGHFSNLPGPCPRIKTRVDLRRSRELPALSPLPTTQKTFVGPGSKPIEHLGVSFSVQLAVPSWRPQVHIKTQDAHPCGDADPLLRAAPSELDLTQVSVAAQLNILGGQNLTGIV